jgi:hypothetical protein
MPIQYELDDARRCVMVRMEGPFSLTDFRAVIEQQRHDNASSYGVLYDLRGLAGEPTITQLRQSLSQVAETHRLRGPLAILVTDPFLYDMACTYAALEHPTLTIRIFHDGDEARQWLTAKLHGGR